MNDVEPEQGPFTNKQIAANYLQRLEEERGTVSEPMPDWYHAGKVIEEAGEAWREYVRLSGWHRHMPETQDAYAEELADTVISAYAAAQVRGIDLDDTIQRKHTVLMSHSMFYAVEPNGGYDENMGTINMAAPVPEIYRISRKFLEDVFEGREVPPDAVGQLVEAFLPCLRIIVGRNYNPNGATWQRAGRKGLVREILKNTDRIRDRDWLGNTRDEDSAHDLINFCGFYLRSILMDQDNWGYWGEPAREREE